MEAKHVRVGLAGVRSGCWALVAPFSRPLSLPNLHSLPATQKAYLCALQTNGGGFENSQDVVPGSDWEGWVQIALTLDVGEGAANKVHAVITTLDRLALDESADPQQLRRELAAQLAELQVRRMLGTLGMPLCMPRMGCTRPLWGGTWTTASPG